MKRIIFLFCALFFVYSIAYASVCTAPDKPGCTAPCPNDRNTLPFAWTYPDPTVTKNKICTNAVKGFENALVGWGKNCAIPAGELYPSQYSCISTGNVLGQVFDTITTLGTAIFMRENFCSFAPGNPELEGAIVSNTIFQPCTNLSSPKAAHKCNICLLRGSRFDESTGKCGDLFGDKIPIAQPQSFCNGAPNLEKPLLDDSGMQVYYNNKPVYCPLTRCNIPTDDIRVKYYDRESYRVAIDAYKGASIFAQLGALVGVVESVTTGDCCDIKKLKNNQYESVAQYGSIKLKGRTEVDRICAQMLFPTGWRTLACKARPPPQLKFANPACFMATSPLGDAGVVHSKWVMPLTSSVVQTVTDIFNSVFLGSQCQSQEGGITAFHNNMKDIVRILLILYVIIQGFRLATGATRGSKRELFMFLIKFALIIYFSVGPIHTTSQNEPYGNGLIFLRNVAMSGMESLSNMIVDAEVVQSGFCNFDIDLYDSNYRYLRMWDILDCKLTSYLGITPPTVSGFLSVKSGTGIMQTITGIFGLLWALLISGNFLTLIFMFAFGIFILSLVIYFTHLYLIAIIAITIMIFFGPIFVPMLLFEKTKHYFNSWLRILFGYALQPVIVVAVISFMIATFDLIMYSDCKFTEKTVTGNIPYWALDNTSPQSKYCKDSFGYRLAMLSKGKSIQQTGAKGDGGSSIIQYNIINGNVMDELEGIMLATFFAFLFYFFANQIGGFAQELSGAPSLGRQAISPTAAIDAIKDAAIATADAATGGQISRAKKLASQVKDPKGSSDKQKADPSKADPNKAARSGVQAAASSGEHKEGIQVAQRQPPGANAPGANIEDNKEEENPPGYDDQAAAPPASTGNDNKEAKEDIEDNKDDSSDEEGSDYEPDEDEDEDEE